jgi:acyl-CoA synthetase (NDP forming)
MLQRHVSGLPVIDALLIVSAGLGHGAGSLAEAAERAAQKYGMRLIGPNCLRREA